MFKKHKRIFIIIGLMAFLSPLGIILPHYLGSGNAWGEWSVDTIRKHTGYEPEGMKKNAELYKAPVPDYTFGTKDQTLTKKSLNYILSGIAGVGIIIMLTFGLSKAIARKKKE